MTGIRLPVNGKRPPEAVTFRGSNSGARAVKSPPRTVADGTKCCVEVEERPRIPSYAAKKYVDLASGTVDELIAYFLALQGRAADEAAFRRRFDLMALQRNLKALGTFGYQTTARRNTVYIQYMPRTLRYARETLHKYTRFSRLAEILSAHVAEFQ